MWLQIQNKPVLKQLPEMIQQAGYRKMLYELCERYGSSQFLLFALQVRRPQTSLVDWTETRAARRYRLQRTFAADLQRRL